MDSISESLEGLLRALGNTIKSLYRLAPAAAITLIGVWGFLVAIAANTPNKAMAAVVIIVLIVSIVIYGKTKNYAEAALSLVLGLFTAFTIDWTPYRFILFTAAYFGFTALILLISSIIIASKLEGILRQASIFIDLQHYKNVEGQLRQILKESNGDIMGPIEKAECVRFLAFKKFPMNSIGHALKAIGQLSVITKMKHKDTTSFLYDLYKMGVETNSLSFEAATDKILSFIKQLPVTPEEFFESFRRTKKFVLTNRASLSQYLQVLEKAINDGLAPGDIASLMESEFPIRLQKEI